MFNDLPREVYTQLNTHIEQVDIALVMLAGLLPGEFGEHIVHDGHIALHHSQIRAELASLPRGEGNL